MNDMDYFDFDDDRIYRNRNLGKFVVAYEYRNKDIFVFSGQTVVYRDGKIYDTYSFGKGFYFFLDYMNFVDVIDINLELDIPEFELDEFKDKFMNNFVS